MYHENEDWKKFNNLFKIDNFNNKVSIFRHGHSEANEQKIIVSSLKNGANNYGLTEKGKKEVEKTCINTKKRKLFKNSLVMYSSPFLRTIETSQIISDILDVKDILYEERLCERYFGEFELKSDNNYEKVWFEGFRNPQHKKWGVESTYEVLERTTSLLTEICYHYKNKDILLITHGDVAMILLSGGLRINPKNHRKLNSLGTGALMSLDLKLS